MQDCKEKHMRFGGRDRANDILYDYWWATLSGGYTGAMARIALEAGSAKRLYEMDRKRLLMIKGVSEKFADVIISHRDGFDLEKEYRGCLEKGIDFIPYYSARYPERLRHISGYPFAVFVKGSLPSDDKRSVAVIGARECSEYGRRAAMDIGRVMAANGVQLVSGMAYGIDGITQASCLEAGGESFGVLGSGADICYPASNKGLYDRLCTQGGIISEYGPGTPPKANLFPARNRIISALSDLVVVVEARLRSGTSITVDMALEQGKDVLVVPGRIYDPLSTGCIQMWKQGAVPISCPEDIMEALDSFCLAYDGRIEGDGREKEGGEFEGSRNSTNSGNVNVKLSENERKLYEALDVYAKSSDRLSEEAGLEILDFMTSIMRLEMLGLAKEMGKGHYIRVLS